MVVFQLSFGMVHNLFVKNVRIILLVIGWWYVANSLNIRCEENLDQSSDFHLVFNCHIFIGKFISKYPGIHWRRWFWSYCFWLDSTWIKDQYFQRWRWNTDEIRWWYRISWCSVYLSITIRSTGRSLDFKRDFDRFNRFFGRFSMVYQWKSLRARRWHFVDLQVVVKVQRFNWFNAFMIQREAK